MLRRPFQKSLDRGGGHQALSQRKPQVAISLKDRLPLESEKNRSRLGVAHGSHEPPRAAIGRRVRALPEKTFRDPYVKSLQLQAMSQLVKIGQAVAPRWQVAQGGKTFLASGGFRRVARKTKISETFFQPLRSAHQEGIAETNNFRLRQRSVKLTAVFRVKRGIVSLDAPTFRSRREKVRVIASGLCAFERIHLFFPESRCAAGLFRLSRLYS
ncbi:hypothetical protein QKG26_gp046 [Chelonid alphaherpesvirus 5]|uniref:Uncharacterized protein n=1 Tax=Chelonid alphaherpesvirus 5 TaxID=702736 RepID=V5NYQ3_9ALPH|nr:hypothetical protein QKG26_gp046 [Chelonid alphaherpesvirus 5]AHA93333.1 hypothetical protein [Chelonid alphaherpesvirus 5]